MGEIKEFKTETKRLLDLMINSIYTNREIFLRELISNASDAIDKYHYLSLQNENLAKTNDYEINLEIDETNRILTIKDNGIGMSYDDIVNNLGTIASSGSLEFMKKLDDAKKENLNEIDIIGKFGVGFYSAFMVAKKVEVITRSPFDSKGYIFTSTGEDSYEISECDKETHGSEIRLFLRDNSEEVSYDEYLEEYTIQSLVKKYSDYIRYPIKMLTHHKEVKKDAEGKDIDGEYVDVEELETLNSMIPLWRKRKSEVSKEDLNNFYKSKFNDYSDPLIASFIQVEGMISYNALVFIPARAPYDLYSDKFEKGLKLYTKGVFILDKCKELVPDYLRFIKGLVDSSDLSLNISREILQNDTQLKKIQQSVEKKILNELENLKNEDYDKYLEFFKNYGINLKYGIYEEFGRRKDLLKDLVVFNTYESQDRPLTLKAYKEKMKEDQKYIYYASGSSKNQILQMPQLDALKKKGIDVLLLEDSVDEFMIMALEKYDDVEFKSISQGDLEILDKEEEKKIDELIDTKKPLIEGINKALEGKVKEVRISKRLVDSPLCLVSGEGLSFEMEKTLAQNPAANGLKAERILEINPNHELFKAVEKAYERSEDTLEKYSKLLLNQALLLEGMEIEDMGEFSKLMCELMIEAMK